LALRFSWRGSELEIRKVFVNLLNRAHDVIHILTFRQQQPVLKPDRFPAGAFRIGAKGFERSVIDGTVVVAASDRASARVEIVP
jgi:hypothetical protein